MIEEEEKEETDIFLSHKIFVLTLVYDKGSFSFLASFFWYLVSTIFLYSCISVYLLFSSLQKRIERLLGLKDYLVYLLLIYSRS